MKNVLQVSKLAFVSLIGMTSFAFGQIQMQLGETRIVGGYSVSCGSVYTPPPIMPNPPKYISVTLQVNYGCLSGIPATDGKTLSGLASSCDRDNQRLLSRYDNCRLVSQSVDYGLAESVISKATTVIHDYQKDNIRESASSRIYTCED